jgi:hypothetical protein
MKSYKFEIILTENDLAGDEFWEEAIKEDGTGIKILTTTLENMISDSNLIISSNKKASDVIRLVNYKDV